MATKSTFSSMLNQKPIAAPKIGNGSVKVKNPPGVKQFAFLGNNLSAHPSLTKFDPDVATSVWGKIQAMKGIKNG